MTGALVARLLARYGQTVELCDPDGARQVVKAVVQPVLERDTEWTYTPLGAVRRGKFLYVGPADGAPGAGGLICRGVRFEVIAARAIYVGDQVSHWWGVLREAEDGA